MLAAASHDDVIVHRDAQMLTGFGNPPGDCDVGAAGLGITARVIVDEDQRGRPAIECAADNLARMDRGLVYRSLGGEVILDKPVLGVEVQHPHAFMVQPSHVDGEVIEQGLPAAEDRTVFHLAA